MPRLALLFFVLPRPPCVAQTPDTLAYDRPPEAVTRVAPVYPDSAAQAGIEGRVYLRAFVGLDSLAARVTVVRGVHPLLDSSAVRAVRQWRFRPAEKAGQPVAAWFTFPVRFRLPEAPVASPLPASLRGPLTFEIVRGRTPATQLVDSLGCRTVSAVGFRSQQPPDYPPQARAEGQPGEVLSWVRINTEGRVTEVEVISSTNRAFAEAAMAALIHWRFAPATCEGQPHEARIQIPIRWRASGR